MIATLQAEPLETFTVTQATGNVIRGKYSIETGGDSRVELRFPDQTLCRIGSNALFWFVPGSRRISLESGTMFLSSPKRAGQTTVRLGLVLAVTSWAELQLLHVAGRVKVVCLDGKAAVSLPGHRAILRYGQMVDIFPGATKIPEPTPVKLETLLSTSLLMQMGSLPNQHRLAFNAYRQKPQWKPIANSPPIVSATRATGAAMTTLGIERQQAAIAAAQQLVAQQAALASQRAAEAQAARQAVAQAAQQLAAQQEAERLAQEAARRQAEIMRQQQEALRLQQEQEQERQRRGNQGNQGQGNQGQGQGQGPAPLPLPLP